MMIFDLVECEDHDYSYNFLVIQNDKGVTDSDVQNAIYKAKKELTEEFDIDWTIEDVIDRLPKKWMTTLEDYCQVEI